MLGQELYQRINVNPNFAAAFLLTFVKNQLNAEMQVVNFNVIGVFLIGIPRPSHESDDIPGIYRLPHRQAGGKGLVLQQVRVVLVALAVIAVPTQCFHRAALNGHNRRAGVSQQVVAQMFPLESKGAAGSKIIVVGIAVALSNG